MLKRAIWSKILLFVCAMAFLAGNAQGEDRDKESSRRERDVNMAIHGYADVVLRSFQYQNSTFDQNHFSLWPTAQISDQINVLAEIEWEHGLETSLGPTTVSSVDPGELNMERAYIEYFLNDAFNLRMGKDYTPFGLWPETHNPMTRVSTLRPLIHDGRLFPAYSTGLQVYGSHFFGETQLDYWAMAANGKGDRPSSNDADSNKALELRGAFTLPQGTRIGLSYFSGLNGQLTPGSTTVRLNQNESMFGADLTHKFGAFTLKGEGVWGRITPRSGAAAFDAKGWYGQVEYFFRDKYTLFARAEKNDLSTILGSTSNREGGRWLAGMNFRPHPLFVWKIEYASHKYEADPAGISSPQGMFLTSVAVGF